MVYKSPFPPVPVSNESIQEKLLRAIWQHGKSHPTQHAIITANDPARCLTFHELHAQIHSVRAFLHGKGFHQGDIACLVISNCIEWVVFQLGAIAAGGAISGASALFTDYELERQFKDSGCSIVLTDEDHLEKVKQAIQKCPTIKLIRVVWLLFLTHRDCVETLVLNLPFFHMFGYLLLNLALVSGATIVVMSKFEPKLFLSTIQTFRPRILFTVPPILLFLAKDPMVNGFDCSSLEFINVGAAPTGKDLCFEFLARHKNVKYLCQGYGMTEMTTASHLPVLKVKEPYLGIGQTVSNYEQKIINNTGGEVAMGELGELCVRSPTVMMGYFNRPEATADTIDKEGWLHTANARALEAR